MKADDRDPTFWEPQDGNETWAQAIAAFATFVIVLIAGFLWYVTFWAAS